jgi:hypothetical protein
MSLTGPGLFDVWGWSISKSTPREIKDLTLPTIRWFARKMTVNVYQAALAQVAVGIGSGPWLALGVFLADLEQQKKKKIREYYRNIWETIRNCFKP